MNYFNYAIKCIIRNIIYKLMKPKVLIPLLVGVIATFLLARYTTVFGWEGNNDYTDKNATIIMQYDSINQDLVNRIKYFDGNSDNIDNLLFQLRNNNMNYYVFYGSPTGSSMDSGSYYATNDLYVYFYDRENFTSSGSACTMYQGMNTNYRFINGGLGDAYIFTGDDISTWTIQNFHIPTVLINYKSNILYDFVNSEDEEQTNSIVGAINQQTNSINQQTNTIQEQTQVIQETQDFISNTTVQDSTMSVDTSSMSVNTSNVDNFFTGFLNTVKNAFTGIDTTVETVSFPIPFTEQSITLRSDAISSHIINTPLYTLLQTFYWFYFGRYIIMLIKRIFDWLASGKMVDEGVFSFIEWLDIHNEIIKAYML